MQHSCCTSFGEAAEQPDSHTPPWDCKMASHSKQHFTLSIFVTYPMTQKLHS